MQAVRHNISQTDHDIEILYQDHVMSWDLLNMACYGVQENDHVVKRKYTKVQCTKKLGCPARIYVQEIVKFPTFAVSMHMSMPLFYILKLFCSIQLQAWSITEAFVMLTVCQWALL